MSVHQEKNILKTTENSKNQQFTPVGGSYHDSLFRMATETNRERRQRQRPWRAQRGGQSPGPAECRPLLGSPTAEGLLPQQQTPGWALGVQPSQPGLAAVGHIPRRPDPQLAHAKTPAGRAMGGSGGPRQSPPKVPTSFTKTHHQSTQTRSFPEN